MKYEWHGEDLHLVIGPREIARAVELVAVEERVERLAYEGAESKEEAFDRQVAFFSAMQQEAWDDLPDEVREAYESIRAVVVEANRESIPSAAIRLAAADLLDLTEHILRAVAERDTEKLLAQ